jgi:uncharacterized membrane protein YsdA (DUF1294 family)/cold shock CspA family protein
MTPSEKPIALPPTTAYRAEVVEWNAERGFGFVDDGRRRIFVHIRDFATRHPEPTVGATVTFELGADPQGRPCGQNVRIVRWCGGLRLVHFVILTALLLVPAVAVYHLTAPTAARGVAYGVAAASVVTFFAYFEDKRRAQRADWRTPERTLHVMALLGGWPGAFLAQRTFRHKNSKVSFLVVFWVTVGLYQIVAIDGLLGWRLVGQISTWVRS